MTWILRKHGDGRTFGPLDAEILRRWAWDGMIDPDDEVSNDDGLTWIRASNDSALDSFLREQLPPPSLVGAATILGTTRSRRRKRSLLDMTPLVDCVFLLLIFFFVATTFNAGAPSAAGSNAGSDVVPLDVSIPKIDDRPEYAIPEPRHIRVVVSESGAISVNGQEVPLASLVNSIRSLRDQHEGVTAIVLADAQVKYGQIARVVAAIEAGGVERVLIGAAGSDK
ncbi:MAG: biopolymer transporter ExbD [Phycisphaerae bacterium]|nr:biopolymer transporter ExbD [Phycisphaerae bacterium]